MAKKAWKAVQDVSAKIIKQTFCMKNAQRKSIISGILLSNLSNSQKYHKDWHIEHKFMSEVCVPYREHGLSV